jgi:hypothetical protein
MGLGVGPQIHKYSVGCFCGIVSWKRLALLELKAAPQFCSPKTGVFFIWRGWLDEYIQAEKPVARLINCKDK